MVVDRNILHTATNSAPTVSWRVSIDPHLFRALLRYGSPGGPRDRWVGQDPCAPVCRTVGGIWGRHGLAKEPEFYEPDRHVTDTPFHTDADRHGSPQRGHTCS
jgi:hypothetical protein